MNKREYMIKNNQKQMELLRKYADNPLKNQHEKDLFNLEIMLLDIKQYSLYYRMGMIKTLRNAIKLLKKQNKTDTLTV